MIKDYLNFIFENNFGGFRTRGEWIESLSDSDDFAKSVVFEYIGKMDPKIRISNAVNTLPQEQQKKILDKILHQKRDDYQNREVEVISHVDLNHKLDVIGGKWTLNSFFKMITSLGQKGIKSEPIDIGVPFIIYFQTDPILVDDFKDISIRFKFFESQISKIPHHLLNIRLYYGIKEDLEFEYGIVGESNFIPLGRFGLKVSTYNWILKSNSVSSLNLKKLLINFDFSKIKFLSILKNEVKKLKIGQNLPVKFIINDNIISIEYQRNDMKREDILEEGKNFFSKYKWSSNIQIAVVLDDDSQKIKIRIK